MRLILIFLCISFTLTGVAEYKWATHSLVNACKIHHINGALNRSFPGHLCLFLEDGSFFTTNATSLKHISKDSEVLWEMKGHFHHQLNFSNDRKKILALSSDFIPTGKETMRVDKFLVLSLDGKIILQQLASDLIKKFKIASDVNKVTNGAGTFPHDIEQTHFNSFYEIPKITTKSPDYIKEGNFVVNSTFTGAFILSEDLTKVLYHRKFKSSTEHQIHDVQVLSNGHLLFFNNMRSDSRHLNRISAIQEMDPATEKIIYEFTSEPKSMFYSRFCGGAQMLDEDTLLFSHQLSGTWIYSKKNKQMISSIVDTHRENEKFIPTQQVKAVDLTQFLSHWK